MSNLEEATEVKGQYGAGQIQVLEGLEAVVLSIHINCN